MVFLTEATRRPSCPCGRLLPAYVAAAPIFVMAALPVSFGGWGTRETAAALCLGAFGAASDSAVAASVLYGLYGACQALIGALLLSLPGRRDA